MGWDGELGLFLNTQDQVYTQEIQMLADLLFNVSRDGETQHLILRRTGLSFKAAAAQSCLSTNPHSNHP